MYSIKATALATGLTVETLRAWERRYGLVQPRRDAAGRRVYRQEDVARLRRLREATDQGHGIGRIAALSDLELARLLAESPSLETRTAASAIVLRMIEAAEQFRPLACEQALTLAVALLAPADLAQEVIGPVLNAVGERWHKGEFSVAQERLVSACVRRQVSLLLDSFERLAHGPAIVFATLPGERHELGLLTAAMLAASRGFRCHYLGADLPAAELAEYACRIRAAVVAVSAVWRDSLPGLQRDLPALQAALPDQCQVWLGGRVAREIDVEPSSQRLRLITDQRELERQLDLLGAGN
jgi:MerR family transcriptional regulator, light-induced transcriptional regulator